MLKHVNASSFGARAMLKLVNTSRFGALAKLKHVNASSFGALAMLKPLQIFKHVNTSRFGARAMLKHVNASSFGARAMLKHVNASSFGARAMLKHDLGKRKRHLVHIVERICHSMSNVSHLGHFEETVASRTDDLVIATVPCSSRATLLRAHVPAPHDRGLETNRRAFEDPHESLPDPEFGNIRDAERHKVPNAAHGNEGREVCNEYGVCLTICPCPHAHRE